MRETWLLGQSVEKCHSIKSLLKPFNPFPSHPLPKELSSSTFIPSLITMTMKLRNCIGAHMEDIFLLETVKDSSHKWTYVNQFRKCLLNIQIFCSFSSAAYSLIAFIQKFMKSKKNVSLDPAKVLSHHWLILSIHLSNPKKFGGVHTYFKLKKVLIKLLIL